MHVRQIWWVPAVLVVAGAAACSSGSSSGAAPPASTSTSTTAAASSASSSGSVDPCTVLTKAQVATLYPGVGDPKVQDVGSTKICNWPDANGIPAVMVQVVAPPGGSLRDDVTTGLMGTAYDVVDVSGVGDEAVAAFQQPDPSKGLTAGMAILEARKGNHVVDISVGPSVVVTQGSPQFDTVKQLATEALSAVG